MKTKLMILRFKWRFIILHLHLVINEDGQREEEREEPNDINNSNKTFPTADNVSLQR